MEDAEFRKKKTDSILENKAQMIEIFADRIIKQLDKEFERVVNLGRYYAQVNLEEMCKSSDADMGLVKGFEIKDQVLKVLHSLGYKTECRSGIWNIHWD